MASQTSQLGPRDLHGAATPATERTSHDNHTNDTPPKIDDREPKRSKSKTVLLMVSVFLSIFLFGLDRTIISTVSRDQTPIHIAAAHGHVLMYSSQAIPRITDDFNSLTDVGWYGSAYLLTCCALQLLFGRIYTFFSIKGTLLTSVLVFEAASALCGAAPNSVAFIIGRAFSGIGAAGIFAGTVSSYPCIP